MVIDDASRKLLEIELLAAVEVGIDNAAALTLCISNVAMAELEFEAEEVSGVHHLFVLLQTLKGHGVEQFFGAGRWERITPFAKVDWGFLRALQR